MLAGKDVRFRHGEDADFDAELGLDKRIEDYSHPGSSETLTDRVDGTPVGEDGRAARRAPTRPQPDRH